MSKDPAFLFYDGDAARDVSHMNRLERGAYFDLIQAQRKFGGFTMEQARKILGKDFEPCWDSLTLILSQENNVFFIEWVRDSIENRKQFAEKQRKRIQDYWNKKKQKEIIPRNNGGISVDIPLENENENEKVISNIIKGVPKILNIPFEVFWNLYDKKEDKMKCITRWHNLTNKEREACIEAIPIYVQSTPDKQYRKNPSTYLNNKSWENEIIKPRPSGMVPAMSIDNLPDNYIIKS